MDDSPAVADGSSDAMRPDGDPDAPSSADGRPGRRRGLSIALAAVAVTAIGLDQLTKFLAVRDLTENVPVTVLDGWLQLRLIRNPGAAFSLATGSTWIFTIIATVVSIVIVRISRELGSRWWAVALGLLLGGALGNLLDRLFRAPGFARGHVVDFIEYLRFPFMDFPIFNVADSCIVVAAGLIAVLGLRGIGIDGRRTVGR
jgi:signal peptidase II